MYHTCMGDTHVTVGGEVGTHDWGDALKGETGGGEQLSTVTPL